MKLRGRSTLKWLDRVGGIPIVRFLGALPKRALPANLERIGILRTAAIGDTLLLSGILRDLRRELPRADIVLITGQENAEAGALSSHGVARHGTISVTNLPAALGALRRERFDVLIDTGSWPRVDALLTALSGARYRVGFRTAGQHRHYAYDTSVDHSRQVHEHENYRSLVRALGIDARSAPAISPAALPALEDRPVTPFMVFHPWAGGYRAHLRQWPLERWVTLASELRSLNARVCVTGLLENAAESADLVDRLRRAGVDAESWAGRLSLGQVGALCRESLGVISTNTGVMHLSALLDVPTVGLNGPTATHRWGPVGHRAKSVASSISGCGFLNLGFEYDGQRADCMLGIDVSIVARTFREVIA